MALLDTVWARVSWDGRIASRHGERSTGYTNAKPSPTPPEVVPLISTAAWERLEMELSRDSELRLLVVLVQVRWVSTTEREVLVVLFANCQFCCCRPAENAARRLSVITST